MQMRKKDLLEYERGYKDGRRGHYQPTSISYVNGYKSGQFDAARLANLRR